jgi:tetratricopeptide (TPR) repeat protein
MNDFTGLFKKGAELFEVELYWEAIDCFKAITNLHPNEPLLDDVYLNLAVCYMKLNLFHEASEFFLPVYHEEVGDGLFEEGSNNYGSTRARAALGLIRINIGLDNINKAEILLGELKEDNSGMLERDVKVSFFEIAKGEIKRYENQKGELNG